MSYIKIGSKVKDIVSGYSGVVTAISKLIHNCDRVQVMKMNDPEKVNEVTWFDIPQVTYEGESLLPVIDPVVNPFKFGDHVKDIYTPFNGTVVQMATWANGCIRIGVQPHELQKGLPTDEMFLPVQQCELVKAKEVAPVSKEEIKPVKTGGPCKLPRMSR